MAEMVDVASHFDTDPLLDGYTGSLLYYGQSTTFNEASPDGSVNKRRTLSMRPNYVIPARRVFSIFGDRWLVGDSNVDGFSSTAIRKTYWLKKATTMANIQTPGQLLAGVGGVSAYIGLEYLKDTVNSPTDAEYDNFWEVFVAADEVITKGMYVTWGNYITRVRNVHLDIAGFHNASSDELDSLSLVTATTSVGGTYDPITESTTGGGPTNYPAVLLDAYKIYRYATQADQKVNAGDMFLVVQSSTPSEVGRTFVIDGVAWRVLTRTPDLDAVNLHIRRA